MKTVRTIRFLAGVLLAGLVAFAPDAAIAATPAKVVVKFDANGGTGKMAKQVFRRGVAQKLRANAFKRKGGVFVGWAKSRNGAVAYKNRQKVKNPKAPGGTLVLYARWAKSTYKVRFMPNGGKGKMALESFKYGTAKKLSKNRFKRSGYVFRGWSDRPNGKVLFPDGKKVKNLTKTGQTVRLYAIWAKEQYKVRFNANGGSGTMSDQSFAVGVRKILRANAFTRTGYTFAGWATSAGGPVVYTNRQSVSNLASANGAVVTLYAVWRVKDLYLVVDLSGGPSATSYPVTYRTEPPSGGFNKDEYKTTKLVLRLLEPGPIPTHNATITKRFYVGLFEVTQRQWELVMGTRPSYFSNDSYYTTRPVEMVSYDMIRGSFAGSRWPASNAVDADSFLGKLRARTGLDFDLPTEAQWEYACRAGTTSPYNNGGHSENDLKVLGRYRYNGGSENGTASVGSYKPNAWGLYDMHGNVWEWCLDWEGESLDGNDPVGPSAGWARLAIGGGCFSTEGFCACNHWSFYCNPYTSDSNGIRNGDLGFRLVRTLSN